MDATAGQDATLDNRDTNYLIALESYSPTTTTTLLPPFIPAGQEVKIHSQFVDNLGGRHDGFTPLGAAPHSVEQPSNLYSVSGAFNQGQNLNVYPQSGGYGWFTPQGAAPLSFEQPYLFMAAPVIDQEAQNAMQAGPLNSQPYSQGQYNNALVMQPQQGPTQNLQPVGVVNGEVVYAFPALFSAPSLPVAPPQPYNDGPVMQLPQGCKPVTCINRRCEESQQADQPYIIKPPNAFMLFMKEQRPRFENAMGTTGSAGVNKLIGQMWKSLSTEEKDKYFKEAYKESLLHKEQYPNWSTSYNYGKKRKRIRTKAAKVAAASEPTFGAVSQPAKKEWVTLASSGMVVPRRRTPYACPQTAVTYNVVASKVVDSPPSLVPSQTDYCLIGISSEVLELLKLETIEALPNMP